MEQQVITSEQIIAYNAWLLNEEKAPVPLKSISGM